MQNVKLILLCALCAAGAACSRPIYPVVGTRLDTTACQVIVPNRNLRFGYADYGAYFDGGRTAEKQFVYPTAQESVRAKVEIPEGALRQIVREAGLTRRDSVLLVHPFALAFLTDRAQTAMWDNYIDYRYIYNGKQPTIWSDEDFPIEQMQQGFIVGQIIDIDRRAHRVLCRHYIPYRGKYLCICYVLQSIDRKDEATAPNTWSVLAINNNDLFFVVQRLWDVTRDANLVYLSKFMYDYIEDTEGIVRQIWK